MERHLSSDFHSYILRKQIVASYDHWIQDLLERRRYELYFVNFMFNQLPGRRSIQMEQMRKEVTRFHDILKRNIVRKPHSWAWRHMVPILVGSPDLIVAKNVKVEAGISLVNEGLHFNALLLLPPRRRKPRWQDRLLSFQKKSRLSVSLGDHTDANLHQYLTPKLYRIHVTAVTEGSMADYALKTYKRGNVTPDDILVL